MTEQRITEEIIYWNIASTSNRIIYGDDTAAFFHDLEGDQSLIKAPAKKAMREIPDYILPHLTTDTEYSDLDELREHIETILIHYLEGHVMYLISMLGTPEPDEPEEKKERFHWTIACMGNRAFDRLDEKALADLLANDSQAIYTECLKEAKQIPEWILLSLMDPNDPKTINLHELHNVIALQIATYVTARIMYHLSENINT